MDFKIAKQFRSKKYSPIIEKARKIIQRWLPELKKLHPDARWRDLTIKFEKLNKNKLKSPEIRYLETNIGIIGARKAKGLVKGKWIFGKTCVNEIIFDPAKLQRIEKEAGEKSLSHFILRELGYKLMVESESWWKTFGDLPVSTRNIILSRPFENGKPIRGLKIEVAKEFRSKQYSSIIKKISRIAYERKEKLRKKFPDVDWKGLKIKFESLSEAELKRDPSIRYLKAEKQTISAVKASKLVNNRWALGKTRINEILFNPKAFLSFESESVLENAFSIKIFEYYVLHAYAHKLLVESKKVWQRFQFPLKVSDHLLNNKKMVRELASALVCLMVDKDEAEIFARIGQRVLFDQQGLFGRAFGFIGRLFG